MTTSNPKPRAPGLISLLILLTLASGGSGCAAAVVGGAGAGAAGGVAYTNRGAQADVQGDVKTVNQHATAALQKMGIQITGTQLKKSGSERDIQAKSGTTDVSVKMTQSSAPASTGMTHVEVVARKSAFQWSQDYAKQILDKIISQG